MRSQSHVIQNIMLAILAGIIAGGLLVGLYYLQYNPDQAEFQGITEVYQFHLTLKATYTP